MHETADDLVRLQTLLDRSYERAGPHLLDVHTPDRRLTAEGVAERLQGMCLLVLATTTADGRPVTGAVDGIFYRGRFHFSSSPESTRFRHIRQRPQVSATHLPGEILCVTVHGTAEMLDLTRNEHEGLCSTITGIYGPRYGDDWLPSMIEMGAAFARIEPERMFTFNGEGLE